MNTVVDYREANDTGHDDPSMSLGLAGHVHAIVDAVLAAERGETDDREGVHAALAALESDASDRGLVALRRIATLFRLEAAERHLLLLCVAQAVDPTLGSRFAGVEASSGRPFVTEGLVAATFGHSPGRVWNPSGPLALWCLVRAQAGGPGEPASFDVDPVVPAWLEGELWIDRALTGVVRASKPGPVLPSWPVDALWSSVRAALLAGRPIQCVLAGEPGSGRVALAAAVAQRGGIRAFVVDTSEISDAEWSDSYVRLQRLAAISGAALIWSGAHVGRPWPALVAPAPIHFLAIETDEVAAPAADCRTERVEMPEPTIAERRALWQSLLPAAAQWPEGELDQLATRYRLGAGVISAVAADAPASAAEAAAGARRRRCLPTDDIVQAIECPYVWDDLVLPEPMKAALTDFAFEIGDRERVWQERAAGRLLLSEPSLAALFCGPSGCGKTMAAQVIAAELQLELLRVNLGSVLSKYIGETARNLSRVFALARRRPAILLFDEADSQFARRTEIRDSHDRYANGDTTHLLQLLDQHRGAVILATNRRSDVDPSFVRRLRHVLEFQRPGQPERLLLWEHAVRAVASEQWEALATGVTELAATVDLSGAQIRNATLTALFSARRARRALALGDLRLGLDRELIKDGRPGIIGVRERRVAHG
jgi:ATPase family protein associated with various cellular activities (AAA)